VDILTNLYKQQLRAIRDEEANRQDRGSNKPSESKEGLTGPVKANSASGSINKTNLAIGTTRRIRDKDFLPYMRSLSQIHNHCSMNFCIDPVDNPRFQ